MVARRMKTVRNPDSVKAIGQCFRGVIRFDLIEFHLILP